MQIIKQVECIDGKFREYRLGIDKETKNENGSIKVYWIPEYSLNPSYDFESYQEIFEILNEWDNQFFIVYPIDSDNIELHYQESIGNRVLDYFGSIKE
jgi:hypothetical protein